MKTVDTETIQARVRPALRMVYSIDPNIEPDNPSLADYPTMARIEIMTQRILERFGIQALWELDIPGSVSKLSSDGYVMKYPFDISPSVRLIHLFHGLAHLSLGHADQKYPDVFYDVPMEQTAQPMEALLRHYQMSVEGISLLEMDVRIPEYLKTITKVAVLSGVQIPIWYTNPCLHKLVQFLRGD